MLTKKSQHAWVVRKLTLFAEEHILDLAGLTVSAVKNKLAGVKKKGKALVEKLIKPIVRAAMTPLPTGSEAPDDGEPPADPLSTLDWETLEKKAKWSNFHAYFDLFGGHPTWGLWSTGETGSDSEAERESQDPTPSGPSAIRSSPASGCAAATSATGKRGNPPPMEDGDTDDDEFGGLATSDASDDHDDSQAASTAVTTVNAVKRPSAGATQGSSDAPSKKTRVDEASSTPGKRGQPAKSADKPATPRQADKPSEKPFTPLSAKQARVVTSQQTLVTSLSDIQDRHQQRQQEFEVGDYLGIISVRFIHCHIIIFIDLHIYFSRFFQIISDDLNLSFAVSDAN